MTIKARIAKLEAVGGSEQRTICIWDKDGDGGKQQIAALIASGEARPNDIFHIVRWRRKGENADSGTSDNASSQQ
jgi:hypothetical protein